MFNNLCRLEEAEKWGQLGISFLVSETCIAVRPLIGRNSPFPVRRYLFLFSIPTTAAIPFTHQIPCGARTLISTQTSGSGAVLTSPACTHRYLLQRRK